MSILAMLDFLNNEVNIGDKVVFLPVKSWKPYEIQYGIVENITSKETGAWCKSLNNDKRIIRYQNQIIKLN